MYKIHRINDNFYRNTIILVSLIFNLDIYNIINNNINVYVMNILQKKVGQLNE